MYHPQVIAQHVVALENHYRVQLREHSVSEVASWVDRLSDAVDEKGRPRRSLLEEEQDFIANELLLTKANFLYWVERYVKINVEGRGVDRMFPLLDSQKFILDKIAALEAGSQGDGVLINVLKAARQVGVSTLAETILAHRVTTQSNIFGLIASDVPDLSAYLFDMLERIVSELPWFLRPDEINHVKNGEILFDSGSHIWVGAGKSTRGTTGQRGQLGRGKSLSVIHLSELSTWESAEQIDDALLPTIGRSPRTLVLLESTAKGRGNWWHKHWKNTAANPQFRFQNVFIPWYAEPKYSMNPPASWIPAPSTLEHANRCEDTSPRWMGKKITPTKAQLFWYESQRSYFEGKDNLKQFLEEYGAVDDDECFQASGRSIFSAKVLDRIQQGVLTPAGILEVLPMRELR